MEKYHVCIDFGGWARTYLFTAASPEEAIAMAVKEFPKGRDFIIIHPDDDDF